jgi:hypothetical protein
VLLANYAQQNRNCVRERGIGFTNPFAQFKPQMFPAFYQTGSAMPGLNLSSFNNGYSGHYAWHMAPVAGGLSSCNALTGVGSISASALAVKLAEAMLSGSGDVSSAIGSLIVQALASISGSGGISSANLQAFLQAVASLSGSGGVSSASLTGLGELIAAIAGTGTANGSTLTAIGQLVAFLTVTGTGLSTANVGEAVWSALAAANNTAGTMGEKLNDAGSASNPWTEIIESGYTAADILKLIAAAVQGDATGLESGAPIFKSMDGTIDRITATYATGTRTVTGRNAT